MNNLVFINANGSVADGTMIVMFTENNHESQTTINKTVYTQADIETICDYHRNKNQTVVEVILSQNDWKAYIGFISKEKNYT